MADGTRPTTSPTSAMEDELIDHWTMRSTRNYLLQHLNWTHEWIERADLREDALQVEEERAVAIYFRKMMSAENDVRREMVSLKSLLQVASWKRVVDEETLAASAAATSPTTPS